MVKREELPEFGGGCGLDSVCGLSGSVCDCLPVCPRVEKNGNYDPLKLSNERVVLKKEEW